MKTILVPMENHDAVQSALETALLLARRWDSYIEGFALRWAINEFMVGDVVGGMPVPVANLIRLAVDREQRSRQRFGRCGSK